MVVSTTAIAILLIAGGLLGLSLLHQAFRAGSPESPPADLQLARRKLNVITATLLQRKDDHVTRIALAQAQEAMESIAECTHLLQRSASKSNAAALASIETSAALLSSVLDKVTQEWRICECKKPVTYLHVFEAAPDAAPNRLEPRESGRPRPAQQH